MTVQGPATDKPSQDKIQANPKGRTSKDNFNATIAATAASAASVVGYTKIQQFRPTMAAAYIHIQTKHKVLPSM